MENQGHSRTQKIQNSRQLAVYCNCKNSNIGNETLEKYLENIHTIKFVKNEKVAFLKITPLNNSLTITPLRFQTKVPPLSLPFSKNLLENAFKDYYRYFSKENKLMSYYSSENLINKTHKTIENHLKKLENNIKKNISSGAQIIKATIEQKKEVTKLLFNCITIDDLPTNLLKLKTFKNYQSCQILIHQKGNTISENLFVDKGKALVTNKVPVVNFNKIHTIIKKSKSKLFNQTQLTDTNLGVMGTFLARSINLTKHTIIIIISRNDFLPASSCEQNYFANLIKNITLVLSELLDEYLFKKKNLHLKLGINNLIFPIEIKDEHDNIICSNRPLQKINYTTQESFNEIYTLKYTPYIDTTQSSDLYHFQRVSLLGELLNTLRHELNNPLFGLKLTTDLLIDENSNEEILETLTDISSNCERCQNIITNFSLLYKNQETYQSFNLYGLLKETIILTKSETRGIAKEVKFPPFLLPEKFEILTNPTWITQIIFNFIINGAQAIKSITDNIFDHKITINVDHKSLNKISTIIISVTDSGPGIKKEIFKKILDPFVTTKKEGTGLGLSICNYLASKLGGKIEFFNNSPLPGATFQIELPLTNTINKIN